MFRICNLNNINNINNFVNLKFKISFKRNILTSNYQKFKCTHFNSKYINNNINNINNNNKKLKFSTLTNNSNNHLTQILNNIPQLNSIKLSRSVSIWIFGMGALVAALVSVGGVTRLTKSGLSMTSWTVQGSRPPITEEEWLIEFNRYKLFPEFKQRQNMTLNEFKYIYYWEYSHRMLGRFVGITFLFPFLYFNYKKMLPKFLYPRLLLLFSLGGLQGLIGWWMVKSGLDNNLLQHRLEKNQEIKVSAYRLATHLSMAFITYSLLIWTGLDTLTLYKLKDLIIEKANTFNKEQIQKLIKIRQLAIVQGSLILCTAISGAFVAGNDAGRAYNTFPMMGEEWIPNKETLFYLQPIYRNFFENTATVQLDHRILALTTLTSIWSLYLPLRLSKLNFNYRLLPRMTQIGLTALAHSSLIQVILGIATLLNYVPLDLAVAHQAGSVIVLTASTIFIHSLKFIKYLK